MVGSLFAVDTSLGVLSTKPEQLMRSMKLFIDSERRRGIEHASLGTANLLYLTLFFEDLVAQRDANEIVERILAVEEPEAHLHTHVQRKLFRHLLRQGSALVVTTHSPHIASVTPLTSLLLLKKTTQGDTKVHSATSAKLEPAEVSDIERYLDVTRAEMLFARMVILVEGTAELYLVPAFAESAGIDLDASGITVCSVQGTNFGPYVRLLGPAGLNIPFVVVTDGDPDDEGIPGGLQRVLEIIKHSDEEPARELEEALEKNRLDEARSICKSAGYMVGSRTLEVDLIETVAEAMSDTYAELVESTTKVDRFRKEINLAATDDKQRKKILSRIEKVGKGRYAQRLSHHINNAEPPPYLADLFSHIKGLDLGGISTVEK